MYATYYKSFKSPANIYSIDKYKENDNRICWLIVTMKELYTLRGNPVNNGQVECHMIQDPNRAHGKSIYLFYPLKIPTMSLARPST